MTQKYLYVRRELYEQNPAKKLNSRRSLTDMTQIFKRSFWFLVSSAVVLLVVMVVFAFTKFAMLATVICVVLFMTVVTITEVLREKYLYHESARKAELEQVQEDYQCYIAHVQGILEKQGINSPEKALKLKQECEVALRAYAEQFNRFGNRTYDLLIGVPLGALISGLIYTDKGVAFAAIAAILVIGVAIGESIRLFQLLRFYVDGHFKDKYLLDALNELEYSNEICEKY